MDFFGEIHQLVIEPRFACPSRFGFREVDAEDANGLEGGG